MSVQIGKSAGNGRYVVRPLALLWGILAVLTLSAPIASRGDDEQAGDVLGKMLTLYREAKSYAGTETVLEERTKADGTVHRMTHAFQIKFQAPDRYRIRTTYTGEGTWSGLATGQEILHVRDGKTIIVYESKKKTYTRMAVSGTVDLTGTTLLNLNWIPTKPATTITFLPDAPVNGQDAYVIQLTPPPAAPGNLSPRHNVLFYIEKQTYHLLKIHQGIDTTVSFSNQSFNATIAASAFKFTPPAGVTEAAPESGTQTKQVNTVPLSQLVKRGTVTFSARPQGHSINDKFVLHPDGSFVHFQGDLGTKGTYELTGDRLTFTVGVGLEVWTLQQNGTILRPPVGSNGVYGAYFRD